MPAWWSPCEKPSRPSVAGVIRQHCEVTCCLSPSLCMRYWYCGGNCPALRGARMCGRSRRHGGVAARSCQGHQRQVFQQELWTIILPAIIGSLRCLCASVSPRSCNAPAAINGRSLYTGLVHQRLWRICFLLLPICKCCLGLWRKMP